MVKISQEYAMLIKNLYLSKGYGARRLSAMNLIRCLTATNVSFLL